MTAYNAIPNNDIDSLSPIDEALLSKLRDNPIAIAEGATGAPKIQPQAFADNSITTAKIAAGAVTGDKLNLTTASISGSISLGPNDTHDWVDVTLNSRAFFPAFRGSSGMRLHVSSNQSIRLYAPASTSYTITYQYFA